MERILELAARPKSLDRKTVVLLDNQKPNARLFLSTVGRALSSRYDLSGCLFVSKHEATEPAQPEVIQEVLRRADVVIAAAGD